MWFNRNLGISHPFSPRRFLETYSHWGLCQKPTWKPFSQAQIGGWKRSVHLPAALFSGLASLGGSGLSPYWSTQERSPCYLHKEEKQQRAIPTTFPQGLIPDCETQQQLRIHTNLSAASARHCLWLGPLWQTHNNVPIYYLKVSN